MSSNRDTLSTKIGSLFNKVGDSYQTRQRHLSSTAGFDALLQERSLRFEGHLSKMKDKEGSYTVAEMKVGTGPKWQKMDAIKSAIKAITTFLNDGDRKNNSQEALDALEGRLLAIKKNGKMDGNTLGNLKRTIGVVDERKQVYAKVEGLLTGVEARIKGLVDAKETKVLSDAQKKERSQKIDIVTQMNEKLTNVDLRSEKGVSEAKAAIVDAAKALKVDLTPGEEKSFGAKVSAALDFGGKTQAMIQELHSAIMNESYCQPASKEALKEDRALVEEVVRQEENAASKGGTLETVVVEEKDEEKSSIRPGK